MKSSRSLIPKLRCVSLFVFFALGACVATTQPQSDRIFASEPELVSAGAFLLPENEIVGAISGNTLYGKYLSNPEQARAEAPEAGLPETDLPGNDLPGKDLRWVEYISSDGRVAYYDFVQLTQGNWQVKNDLVCFSYQTLVPQPDNCFLVYALGDRYYFVSTRSQTRGQVVTVVLGRKNGNAEGLKLK
ncbi:hypothetical protein O4H49_04850 [Kiloniella laminariae]|uniref:Lipoprotein n=1 Tax=Kiloniella laminariae TaxID=454162 RepID=A0ABT4LG62_9PROT|nr:hypothetical protein [Kiloniella laminariae]MCZ4280091.1 hypothetical protein [Kiloniella laminariae]